jgi:dihydrofolate reductase
MPKKSQPQRAAISPAQWISAKLLPMARLSLIVAMAQNRVIGVNNHLPWNIPEDLKRFKAITQGHPIIMGRKTFESIGKPLPKRTNIVVTREPTYRVEGGAVAHSFVEALDWARKSPGAEEIFCIGGSDIFKWSLPLAWRIYLTEIDWPFEGDTYFPTFPEDEYREVSKEQISETPLAVLRVLERKKPELAWS